MADTFTTKLGLLKPDPLDAFSVNVQSGNFDTLDANIGIVMCTSSSHPSSPWEGMPILEIDTGNRYVYHSGQWYSLGGTFTHATRPANAVVGAKIIETDTAGHFVWLSGNWYCTGGQFTSTTRPPFALFGCKIYETDTGIIQVFVGVWKPAMRQTKLVAQPAQSGVGTLTGATTVTIASITLTDPGYLYDIVTYGMVDFGAPTQYAGLSLSINVGSAVLNTNSITKGQGISLQAGTGSDVNAHCGLKSSLALNPSGYSGSQTIYFVAKNQLAIPNSMIIYDGITNAGVPYIWHIEQRQHYA